MKFIKYLVLALGVVAFAACGNEAEDTKKEANKITLSANISTAASLVVGILYVTLCSAINAINFFGKPYCLPIEIPSVT